MSRAMLVAFQHVRWWAREVASTSGDERAAALANLIGWSSRR